MNVAPHLSVLVAVFAAVSLVTSGTTYYLCIHVSLLVISVGITLSGKLETLLTYRSDILANSLAVNLFLLSRRQVCVLHFSLRLVLHVALVN